MAMSYHMEARLKQDRINKWNEQKRRAESGFSNQGLDDGLQSLCREQREKVLTADPGQFHQIRSQSAGPSKEVPYETGVVFKKVVHDPNFNFRTERAMGGNVLHVDPVYKIMYPDSFSYRKA